MTDLANKNVLVLGCGPRGFAACEMLRRAGARVVAVDDRDTPELRQEAAGLKDAGVEVSLGVVSAPDGAFDFAVVSPSLAPNGSLMQSAVTRDLPLVSEIELGSERVCCLQIAVAGTNGKSTTAALVQRMLEANHRKTAVAGDPSRPVCAVVEGSKDLDFLILQVETLQLERTHRFRPSVAVLTNLAPDHLDRYASPDEYALASARLFRNQQAFDWAIVQKEALERLRKLGTEVPGKTVSFSAADQTADLCLDRGLVISRLPNWQGPLLDLDQCKLRGPHNAENLMAALAVGHVLRLPLDTMLDPLKAFSAGPHRYELVGEADGVQYINDAKAANIDALSKALQATRVATPAQPNILLIAGGRDKGLDFHSLGPLLSARVKHAFLIGEASEKMRAAWSLFTPCTVAKTLVEAVAEAAKNAVSGDVVLLSPACSCLDQFRNYQDRGESFCQAVKSIRGGAVNATPNINGKN